MQLLKKPGIKRVGYFSLALLILFSTVLYGLFIRPASKVSAATVGSSSDSAATGSPAQKKIVVATNGTIFVAYNASSQTPSGIVYRTSTDSGNTWSSATQIDTTSTNDFSIAIDSNNNIYIVFTKTIGTINRFSNINGYKLTYSSGSWTLGSLLTVFTGHNNCSAPVSGTSLEYTQPTISVNSNNIVVINSLSYTVPSFEFTCDGTPVYDGKSSRTSDFSSFTYHTLSSNNNVTDYSPIINIGADFWTLTPNGVISKDLGGTGSWTATTVTIPAHSGSVSLSSAGSDELNIFYKSTTPSLVYQKYTISSNTLSLQTTISSASNDVLGAIVANNSNLYAFYQSYVAANSYNIVYKKFNGTSWDASSTAITTDNLNNTYISSLVSKSGGTLPLIWTTGTASPWTVKSGTVALPNITPSAPTLIAPTSGATGQANSPTFQFRTSDSDNDYLKYKIIIYNSDCSTSPQTFDQTSSQTGWSGQDASSGTAYVGSSSLTSSTIANFSGAALTSSTQYCWKAAAVDPAGTNIFGAYSSTRLFTTGANVAPAAPTLIFPGSGATGTSTSPLMQVRTTDSNNDYLRYKILIYNSDCSTGLQTYDQTVSQTGWSGQDLQSGTAYTGNSVISSSTVATYGAASLSPSTQYCWKAAAIDPAGTNGFSSFSSTQLFTTGTATGQVEIRGGVEIRGNTLIR